MSGRAEYLDPPRYIGDVIVHRGVPVGRNPYASADTHVCGDERVAALTALYAGGWLPFNRTYSGMFRIKEKQK